MPGESPSWLERWREGRQDRREDWRDRGRGVADYLEGLDLGEGQVFDRQVGSGRLSVNLPTAMGKPKVGSVADFMRDPQAWGDAAEQDQWDTALRASYTIPIGGGGAAGGRVGKRPRYMNDGGIASLLSNGGSEAMMLGLEGEGEPPFNMQEAYDEELGIRDPRDPFSSLTPELMQEIGEMIMPGGGMMNMGKMGFGALGKFFNRMRRGKSKSTDVGEEELAKIRKDLDMPEYSPKGQDPRPPSLGTYRSTDVPNMRYGGAPSYKKGYYGKSYK